jgi:hypothetical protein
MYAGFWVLSLRARRICLIQKFSPSSKSTNVSPDRETNLLARDERSAMIDQRHENSRRLLLYADRHATFAQLQSILVQFKLSKSNDGHDGETQQRSGRGGSIAERNWGKDTVNRWVTATKVNNANAWFCLSRRRTTPAQPSTRRDFGPVEILTGSPPSLSRSARMPNQVLPV